jgi:hypothetical protein
MVKLLDSFFDNLGMEYTESFNISLQACVPTQFEPTQWFSILLLLAIYMLCFLLHFLKAQLLKLRPRILRCFYLDVMKNYEANLKAYKSTTGRVAVSTSRSATSYVGIRG